MNGSPEILAPCGNMAAFHAALSSGADAMYLALKSFGARAYAANFELSELLQVIEEAHLHERKIYLTLNTLLKDEELKRIPAVMDPLYRAGLDAVLVQDFGLYRLLRERYPELMLHASTQMNLCSVEGAAYARSLGFTRVVPARELTLKELKEIREKAEIEVEAFVHGAMCYCYSGRCYLSSFQGGRSGNRGRCAQPCRKRINGAYRFSMKDLCTLTDVPALMDAGIDSLKIEGRMKNEYYVAACVDAYRTMVEDHRQGVFSEEKARKYEERLAEVFNRGGFTHGYLRQVKGPDMLDMEMPGRAGVPIGEIRGIASGKLSVLPEKELNRGDSLEIRISPEEEPVRLTVGDPVPAGRTAYLAAPSTRRLSSGMQIYRVRNARITQELEDRFLNRMPQIPVWMEITLAAGKRIRLVTRTVRDTVYETEGIVAETATARPVTDSVLRDKIGTLSDTGFELKELVIQNDKQSFIPAGEIKRLRRESLEWLRKELIRKGKRPDDQKYRDLLDPAESRPEFPKHTPVVPEGPVCFVTSIRQARYLMLLPRKPAVLVFRNDLSYMDPAELKLFAKNRGDVRFILGFPAIYRSLIPEEIVEELFLLGEELDGVYLPGIDSLSWYLERLGKENAPSDKVLFLGEALYQYNHPAAEHFRKEAERTGRILWTQSPVELTGAEAPEHSVTLVYGKLPLMRTVQNPGDLGASGMRLLQNPKLCYNSILSDHPVVSFPSGAAAFLFTDESEQMMEKLLRIGHSTTGDRLVHELMNEIKDAVRHKGLL